MANVFSTNLLTEKFTYCYDMLYVVKVNYVGNNIKFHPAFPWCKIFDIKSVTLIVDREEPCAKHE